jgi:hypothetical protein
LNCSTHPIFFRTTSRDMLNIIQIAPVANHTDALVRGRTEPRSIDAQRPFG